MGKLIQFEQKRLEKSDRLLNEVRLQQKQLQQLMNWDDIFNELFGEFKKTKKVKG